MTWIYEGLLSYVYAVYFLLFTGVLVQLSLTRFNSESTVRLENASFILSSFVISLTINGFLGALVEFFDVGLDRVKILLLLFHGILIAWLFFNRHRIRLPDLLHRPVGFDLLATVIITITFFAMAIQGGILDFMADGWWHMSIANRMVQENALLIQYHPFIGVQSDTPEVFYPPLWHLQLALIQEASNLSMPVIWHFIAGFNVALLLLAFYLLSSYLSGDKKIALMALVLHIFLVGGLNSYFRVASWPGNTSYILFYYAIFLTFRALDEVKHQTSVLPLARIPVILYRRSVIILSLCCLGMVGLHGVELVLFVMAIGVYFFALVLVDVSRIKPAYYVERKLLGSIFFTSLLVGTIAAMILVPDHIEHVLSAPRAQDPYLNFIVPSIAICLCLIAATIAKVNHIVKKSIAGFVCLIIFALFLYQIIDFQHIKTLFFADLRGGHIPRDFYDQFDNRVFLPFWDHQLRGALLFSGLLSLILGWILLIWGNNRLSLFVGANSIFVLLVLTSPYFFTLVSFLLPLKSVYRVHILLFSPLIIAAFFGWLSTGIRSKRYE